MPAQLPFDTACLLAEAQGDLALLLDHQGLILDFSPSFLKATGFQPVALKGQLLHHIHLPNHAAPLLRFIQQSRPGQNEQFVYPLLQSDKKLLPVRASLTRQETNCIIIYRDLSDYHRLQVENSLLSHALRGSTECISVLDPSGVILFVNDMFLSVYQLDRSRSQGIHFSELFPEGFNPELLQKISPAGIEELWRGEVMQKKLSGQLFSALLTLNPIKDQDGRPVVIIAVAIDISERKQLEDQLRQSQKMEAIGQLAGGIAHDFNNLLTVIDGYTELILNNKKLTGSQRNYVGQIKNASERAGAMTKQLLAFGRRQLLQPRVLKMNRLVTDISKMLQRLLGEKIELSLRLKAKSSTIKADLSQIEQVIMNLCINARDAMPDGGKLVIETDRVHIDDDYVWRHEGSRLGDFVVLKISDTGIGIPKNIQERIFEPFFTTKGKNKGTGLGLATVYGIIKQSGGNIWVYSEPGRGTSFKIYLPVFSVKAEPKPELKHKVELRPERFKILVVEDEMMVRELVVESLENFGYIVLSAANGEEAIRLYKNHKDEIELILTDVVMPGLSGKQLIEAISKISEDFRVLYMSGYTDDIIGSQGELSPDAPFIEKPFSPTQLIEKIQSLMKSDTIAVI